MPDRTAVTAVTDGTAEGLLTALYMYYYGNLRPEMVVDGSLPSFQQTLGAEYVFVKTDQISAEKVFNAIESKFSGQTRRCIGLSLLSAAEDKLFDIFRYILLAFKDPKHVDDREQFDFVIRIHKLTRNVGMEAHLLTGFARFKQTSQGVLYAEISPKNNVLSLVMDHFTDRLGNERFVIHDTARGLAGVYDTREYIIAEMPKNLRASFDEDSDEQSWQELWTTFYNTIGIQERKNSKLRRQLSPKYFWKNMTEHQRREHWQ
ncbi:MAG: TIGR03915 family putative DNA repair protein [Defluviitaleaceae bacterium]|nr:TIGR03915 family putative DNA repair protein [Defluviitaleaceae bacterium]MCL2836062.1 TIGR03915 family putative DNA repair protein [Defluviitaleaceae bacterium]